MRYLIYFLKGAVIGGTMLIPGVSGGTMAMAFGMYHKLISAVANIRKKFLDSILLLLPFALGGVLGAVLLASPIEMLMEKYRLPVMYFFIGAILGGVPLMLSKAFTFSQSKRFSLRDAVCIAVGAVVPFAINILPEFMHIDLSGASGITGTAVTFAVGIVCALSLSLPGISTSYMLLILGVYDKVLGAFRSLDVLYMLPMAVGALVGLFIFSKFMEKQLDLHPRASYTLILGFILGSVLLVFPFKFPSGAELVICPMLCAIAFALMYILSKYEK